MTLYCATCLNEMAWDDRWFGDAQLFDPNLVDQDNPARTCPTTEEPHRLLTCPAVTTTSEGETHTIVGCGSSNLQRDDIEPQVFDCLNCGIWFDPNRETPEPLEAETP